MSRHYGPIFQVGYVVRDFDATVRHWTDVMGVGPFYLFPTPIDFSRLELRGRPMANKDLVGRAALAYSGDTQIEIILPGSAPSPYHEFLDSGRQGVHHVGVDCSDFDEQLAHATKSGIEPAVVGELPGFRFAYLGTDVGYPGAMLELIELGPAAREMFAMIKKASVNWNGADPVRKVG